MGIGHDAVAAVRPRHYRRRSESHRAEGSDRREPETLDVARVRLEAAVVTHLGDLVGVVPRFVRSTSVVKCAWLVVTSWTMATRVRMAPSWLYQVGSPIGRRNELMIGAIHRPQRRTWIMFCVSPTSPSRVASETACPLF